MHRTFIIKIKLQIMNILIINLENTHTHTLGIDKFKDPLDTYH